MSQFVAAVLLLFGMEQLLRCSALENHVTCSGIVPMPKRDNKISILDFGGAGDGKTLNTKAFRDAIYNIEHSGKGVSSELYIPPGVYLTESFNLTSRMTLYLDRNAVIKASQDIVNWPLVSPLPSYGRGRERPGWRYKSFIYGEGLHDVVITGENGTIDGQGEIWWNMWRKHEALQHTRPHMVELMNSTNIIISNVVFNNSPFWNIHPVYSSNVVVRYVTILAPHNSPNTDGIDPDSSSNVCIEDSYISVGDDIVAVKSGWDEYGIAYARPSQNIIIRRVSGSTPYAGIAVGSETSGGVENVLAENITIFSSGIGIHIKTNTGRGAFIRNITVSNMYMEKVRKGIKIAGDVGDHPDDKFNPKALPVVENIRIRHIRGENVIQAGFIQGLKDSPFTRICLHDINFKTPNARVSGHAPVPWKCSDVSGVASQVSPSICALLTRTAMAPCSIQF